MDIFKEQHPPNQSDVNHQGAIEPKATDNGKLETQQQESQQDSADSESAELNALLKLVLDPNTQSQPLDKPKSLVSSKMPRNKRKAKQPNTPTKPSYNPPMYGGNTNSNKDSTDEPMHKNRKLLPSARKQSSYV